MSGLATPLPVVYDSAWLAERLSEQGLPDSSEESGIEVPDSLRAWAVHTLGNKGLTIAAALMSATMCMDPDSEAGMESLSTIERALAGIEEVGRALRYWSGSSGLQG